MSSLDIFASPDFSTAMGKDHFLYAHYYEKGMEYQETQAVLTLLHQSYNALMPFIEKPFTSPKIPKIIHQIWLGSTVPVQFKVYMKTWQTYHPEWEYKLWTDKEITDLELTNQKAYDAAINYAERSDIARYEILYRFGGLYVDIDFECLKPFDTLHEHFDFYTGLELPAMALSISPIIIPNGLIGSVPGHSILLRCINTIKRENLELDKNDIIKRTGPILFMNAIMETLDTTTTRDIVMPALYFYPIDKKTKGNAIRQCIQSYTYAIHHWAGSWMYNAQAFVPGITIGCRPEGNAFMFTITR